MTEPGEKGPRRSVSAIDGRLPADLLASLAEEDIAAAEPAEESPDPPTKDHH